MSKRREKAKRKDWGWFLIEEALKRKKGEEEEEEGKEKGKEREIKIKKEAVS